MAVTPKKLVRWDANNVSISDFASPSFQNGSMDSMMLSTSSLEFINSQLVAHGFTTKPGLSLDGTSVDDAQRVVKCLLSMLGQRVEDMERTEELTTKLRTLSYDHERLMSMHRTAVERAANAERETNLHKSRLTTALRSLQTSEQAHKQTTAELQRTRTNLQGVRATAQAELKKKEKDIERMAEKWQKLSDAQLKSTPSGMRCANAAVVDGSEVLGKGQGFLEVALEQAEQAREQLGVENLHLRKLVLRAVNEMQLVLHKARSCLSEKEIDEPVPFTLTTLFPMSPATMAADKIASVIEGLQESLAALSNRALNPPTANSVPQLPTGEIERLQSIITALKEELARSQKQSMAHAVETQAMFDKFAEDHRVATNDIDDMSVELMSVPLRDQEKDRLDKIRLELDMERQKFTEAAIKLGREKAAMEAERIKFLDEKRSWQVEVMLADLPPTPAPASPVRQSTTFKPISPMKSPRKSPRKSPAKINVGKASPRKMTRVSHRSLASPVKVVPAYETEVIPPPLPAPTFLKPLAASLLPSSFVLPPPSPHASLPTRPALPPAAPISPPEASSSSSVTDSIPSSSSSSSESTEIAPSTPPAARRPFPVAKPFAQRMIHAYSPAKPSPLSRILMLADSPLSINLSHVLEGDSSGLGVVREEDESGGGLGYGSASLLPPAPQEEQMSLAAELGVESPPDTPLQEKKVERNVQIKGGALPGKGRVFFPEPKKLTSIAPSTVAKGKAKAEALPSNAGTRGRMALEKENSDNSKSTKATGTGKVSPPGPIKASTGPVESSKKAADAKPNASKPAFGAGRGRVSKAPPIPVGRGGGPRRVLVDSADAPPIGKSWRG